MTNGEVQEAVVVEETILNSGKKLDTTFASLLLKFSISHNYNTFGGEVQFSRSTNNPDITEEMLQENVRKAAFREMDNAVAELKTRTQEIKKTIIESQAVKKGE